jgi:hypothetical protein
VSDYFELKSHQDGDDHEDSASAFASGWGFRPLPGEQLSVLKRAVLK